MKTLTYAMLNTFESLAMQMRCKTAISDNFDSALLELVEAIRKVKRFF